MEDVMKSVRSSAPQWGSVVSNEVSSQIVDTLKYFRTMLASDGGSLEVQSFEPGQELVVAYTKGVNEDCPACVLTSEDLAVFIQEALRERMVPCGTVRV